MPVDHAQLGALIDRHAAALELFARQWTDSAADVVQEAFLELVRQSGSPVDVVAWLFRVVRNRAISAARSAGRRRRHETAAVRDAPPWFESSSDAALDAAAAIELLKSLPEEQREVVVGHVWGGLTFEQIGMVAGISSSTAHRRYLSGLQSLRERLGIACPEN